MGNEEKDTKLKTKAVKTGLIAVTVAVVIFFISAFVIMTKNNREKVENTPPSTDDIMKELSEELLANYVTIEDVDTSVKGEMRVRVWAYFGNERRMFVVQYVVKNGLISYYWGIERCIKL